MADQQDPGSSSGSEIKRAAERQAVLKRAKVLFDDCVVDCLVLNVSETGARVRTAVSMPIPERVRLQFSDGATFPAARRWMQGLELGFSFEGTASLPDAAAELAGRIHEALRAASIEEPMRLLRSANFFGDPALQKLAETAEAAWRNLEDALAKRAQVAPSR